MDLNALKEVLKKRKEGEEISEYFTDTLKDLKSDLGRLKYLETFNKSLIFNKFD
jgi:hypothetical protein